MWIEFAFNAHRVNANSIRIQTGSSVKSPLFLPAAASTATSVQLSLSVSSGSLAVFLTHSLSSSWFGGLCAYDYVDCET